jgi:hypothetical protein
MRTKVERLMASKGNSFEQQVIYRVSVAAAPLAAWVKANMAYSKVRYMLGDAPWHSLGSLAVRHLGALCPSPSQTHQAAPTSA